MASLNKILLLGNMTRNPELRYIASGTAVCTFGFAVNTKMGEREDVLFIDVTSFGKTAELVEQYLKKGSAALIEGRLQLQQWESQDGQKRSKHLVVAERVQFMPSGERAGETDQPRDQPQDETPKHYTVDKGGASARRDPGNQVGNDDDLPF